MVDEFNPAASADGPAACGNTEAVVLDVALFLFHARLLLPTAFRVLAFKRASRAIETRGTDTRQANTHENNNFEAKRSELIVKIFTGTMRKNAEREMLGNKEERKKSRASGQKQTTKSRQRGRGR